MESQRCHFQGCSLIPRFQCACEEPHSYYCNEHIVSHMEKGINKIHAMLPLFVEQSDEDSGLLELAIQTISELKSNIVNEVIQNHHEKINRVKSECSKKIIDLNRIFSPLFQTLQAAVACKTILRNSSQKFINEINQIRDLEERNRKEKLNHIFLDKLDASGISYSFKELEERIGKLKRYTVQAGTKNLIEIDREFKKKIIPINSLEENFNHYSGICVFEDGDVFCCGGNNYTTSCYRIDPISQKSVKLQNMPVGMRMISPTRIDDYIYVFGGNNSNGNLSSALRYSISNGKWESLPNMPFNSFDVSSISVKNSIWLSGYSSQGIYEYNPTSHSYNQIFQASNGYGCLLKTFSGQLFFLNAGTIYEYSENEDKWNQVGSYNANLFNSYIESSPEQHGDYFSIMIHSNSYVRFNFKTLSVDNPALN